jgi:hypothetical protein
LREGTLILAELQEKQRFWPQSSRPAPIEKPVKWPVARRLNREEKRLVKNLWGNFGRRFDVGFPARRERAESAIRS